MPLAATKTEYMSVLIIFKLPSSLISLKEYITVTTCGPQSIYKKKFTTPTLDMREEQRTLKIWISDLSFKML